MKATLFFIKDSFDFNVPEDSIKSALKECSKLIKTMGSGFVTFLKSNEFDINAADQLFKRIHSTDTATMMGLLYDQQMTKVKAVELSDQEIYEIINTNENYQNTWCSTYCWCSNIILTSHSDRTIFSEKELVNFCSLILVQHSRSHSEYANNFVQIYQNLIFLDNPQGIKANTRTFNSIRKIEGGYQAFIKGITDCLNYMNFYNIIPHDSQKNIDIMNAELEFSVTPEGKGKNKRKIKALKRDFNIGHIEYKSVNCEYHYKLERVDGSKGNGTYYYNRIYFGFFNRINPAKPQIAIAHIGEHL